MKAASLNELKKELGTLPPKQVLALCIRLAKYKKENKELLSYLLYEANDEKSYIKTIKSEIDLQFAEINRSNLYYTKKMLRKILRGTNKCIKFSGNKQTEVELLIYFCTQLKDSGIPIHNSTALSNLYQRQIEKIKKATANLHEDLQFDYGKELEPLL
jgi:hypothetical protein